MNARQNGSNWSEKLIEEAVGPTPLTTRLAVTDRVAAGWLAANPEVAVTETNLSKTLQQLLTEVFCTGAQRGRTSLSGYAASLLAAAAVGAEEFGSARVFSKSADMPDCYARHYARLSVLLAPLAAAIQLARIAVADAAVDLARHAEAPTGIRRPALRGFVESRIRPHAQQIHQDAGYALSAAGYLSLILAEKDQLAAEVLAAAQDKLAQSDRMCGQAREALDLYMRTHGRKLWEIAARRHGDDAEEVYAQMAYKLAIGFRNRPGLDIDLAYGRKVLDNAAKSLHDQRQRRAEVELNQDDRLTASADEFDAISIADTIVRRVLHTADTLAEEGTTEDGLARELLLKYFFVDPTVIDPHRVELSQKVLDLSGGYGDGHDLERALRSIAVTMTPSPSLAKRITAMAVKALRSWKEHRA